jgi:hypothetical protein
MRPLWAKLFPRRCPICRTEVRCGSAGAVRSMGTWCCSQAHADAYVCRLDDALDAFPWRHAARHGGLRAETLGFHHGRGHLWHLWGATRAAARLGPMVRIMPRRWWPVAHGRRSGEGAIDDLVTANGRQKHDAR